MDGFACAASNPLRRTWTDKHHIVNPFAGQPAHDMAAVYVQATSCLIADSYSTALFAMGYKNAKQWYKSRNKKSPSVEFMLVSSVGSLFTSDKFGGVLFGRL